MMQMVQRVLSDSDDGFSMMQVMSIAVLAALAFALCDRWLPISAASEELVIVALLCALEFGRRCYQKVSPSVTHHESKNASKALDVKSQLEHCDDSDAEMYPEYPEMEANILPRLQAAARAGDTCTAEALLAKMRKTKQLSAMSFGAVISAFARNRNAHGAERWLKALIAEGIGKPNVISVNMVISTFAKQGNVAKAEYWLMEMPRLGLEAEIMTYNAVIDACAQAGDIDRAEHWLQKVRQGPGPNIVSFSSVLHACAKAGDADRAEQWLERMQAEDGLTPNVICYNSVIHACCRRGELRRAEDWLARLQESGVQPTVTSYGAIIDCTAKSGKAGAAEAEAWIRRMEAAGIKADVASYNMVLSAHCKSSMRCAERFLQTLYSKKVPVNTSTLNLLLGGYARLGDTRGAIDCLRSFKERAVRADGMTWKLLVKAVTDASSGALQLLETMISEGFTPELACFNAILAHFASKKDVPSAERCMKCLIHAGLEPDAASHLAMLQACAGDAIRGEYWLSSMASKGLEANASVITQFFHGIAKLGDVQRLERLLRKYRDAGGEPVSGMYNALISAHAQRGDVEQAQKWFEEMVDVGCQGDVASFSALVHACAKSNQLERAETWIEKMEASGVPANVVTYNSMINACARCANADRAEVWLRRMEQNGLHPVLVTYNSLVNAFVKAGRRAEAEEYLPVMCNRGIQPDAVTYSTLIHAWVSARDPARAEMWLKQMLANCPKQAKHVAGQPSAFCFNSVIEAWADEGQVDRAMQWLKEAPKSVDKQSLSIGPVLAGLLKASRVQEAALLALQVPSNGWQAPRYGPGSLAAVAAALDSMGAQNQADSIRALAKQSPARCGQRRASGASSTLE